MNVIFIHHSCFLVELDEKVLLFDWFGGDRVNGFRFGGVLPEYDPDTPFYVFSSHSHRDHFDMDVLRLADRYRNIHFILSKDCKMSPHFLEKHGFATGRDGASGGKDGLSGGKSGKSDIREKICYVSAGGSYRVGDAAIETLRSTDAGVAFYVTIGGVSFFHAGDLNNWKWDGAGDLVNGGMERAYKHEIRKLTDKKIHIAFVPLDPRLKENMYLGLDYFVKHTDADYIFPMHMWQDYSPIREYRKRISNEEMAERIVDIRVENQIFEIGER